jgi:sphingomyelin phosphodiesterase acid-like 3
MKRNLAARALHIVVSRHIALLCLFLFTGVALAQSGQPIATSQAPHKAPPSKATIPALLISDIHFEPFWDTAKVPQLAAAPVSEWRAILAAAPSHDHEQRFAALQQSCHARGADTPFALFYTSLMVMRSYAAGAKFVTVSGDLISHSFQCKYSTLFPDSTPADYRAFTEKTIAYVMGELYGAFPNVPVYVALGNNDSDCGDYRLDTHSEFLAATGREVTKNFPASERQSAEESFAAGGYYSVSLPAPIENARLLVLNDIFMSKNYATCAGKPDPTAADTQLAWLRQQLTEARAKKQKIWVMGHIPPGIDLYATVSKFIDVCGGQAPIMYLASEKMADELVEFSDVVQLAIFGHNHMDEMRILKDDAPSSSKGVAVKVVSSISPINGNHPSITLAQIDPSSAALLDYTVFDTPKLTGKYTFWIKEYNFARSYYEKEFTSSSVSELIAGFAADPSAKTQASQNYIVDFSVGYATPLLSLAWPQYVCTLSNHTAKAFKACVCPAAQ